MVQKYRRLPKSLDFTQSNADPIPKATCVPCWLLLYVDGTAATIKGAGVGASNQFLGIETACKTAYETAYETEASTAPETVLDTVPRTAPETLLKTAPKAVLRRRTRP